MYPFDSRQGIGTLVNHIGEGDNPQNAHITPIYQTSTFRFPDVDTGAAIFQGQIPGYYYTRLHNPNQEQVASKIAVLEALDLLRAELDKPLNEVVGGLVFASGMAAITAAILARVKGGDTMIAQRDLYSATYLFLSKLAPLYGIQVVWIGDSTPEAWEAAFRQNPAARLAYVETPVNPTLNLVDLVLVAKIAHRYGAWLVVDNTFATPYCQRPLTLGADVVVHSTTKYISGHGLVIGGAVVSRHTGYVQNELNTILKTLGGSASPFDCWLTNIGLKTFELRMERHCTNAMQIARWLEGHPAVSRVYYPGLESHPQHALAQRQMNSYGGMISFELKGGLKAGVALMNRVRLCTLAVSLGSTDTLIQHPASMTHSNISPEARQAMGISEGLVRFSVGVENVEDILADLEQGLGESKSGES